MNHIDLDGVGIVMEAGEGDQPMRSSCRPGHDRPRWWTTTEAESHFFDLPDFDSASQRARFIVGEMGRAALGHVPGATADDPLFDYGGRPASLNDLLAAVGRDAVDELLDTVEGRNAS